MNESQHGSAGDSALRKSRIAIIEGKVTTTSLVVTEHFEKNHFHVLRDIRDLIQEQPDWSASNFGLVEYVDAKGAGRSMYRLSRDGYSLLAMGFTGKKTLAWKIAYIEAFNTMEQALAGRSPVASADAASLDTLSPRQVLQFYYAVDRQMVSAAVLWQLMLMGAHRGWVTLSLHSLIRALGTHLSASGVHKVAHRLAAEGLTALRTDNRWTTQFFVIARAVRERIDGALAELRRLPGLPEPISLPAGGKR